MAQAIQLTIPARDPKQELIRRLDQAPIEHAEALLSGIEVIQALHDAGVLEIVKGALNSGKKVLEIAVKALNTPEAIRAARNAMILARVFGSIEPELMEKFASAMPDALAGAARAEETKAPGFIGIMKIFRSENLRHGLSIVNNLLEAWGKNFSASNKS